MTFSKKALATDIAVIEEANTTKLAHFINRLIMTITFDLPADGGRETMKSMVRFSQMHVGPVAIEVNPISWLWDISRSDI